MSIGRNEITNVENATTLQYANGITQARRTSAARFGPHIGFHVEVGRSPLVDAAMKEAKVQKFQIRHQQGGARIVEHWDLTFGNDDGWRLPFFVVSKGPVARNVAGSLAGRNAYATAEAGIGVRWGQNTKSKAAVRGFLHPLVRVGFLGLFQISVTSRMTDQLLRALVDHRRACGAVDTIIDRVRHPEVVEFHEVALVIKAGAEEPWGKGGNTAQVTPFVSAHPDTLDAEYLRPYWRPEPLHTAAYAAFPGIVQWAHEFQMGADEPGREGREADEPGGEE